MKKLLISLAVLGAMAIGATAANAATIKATGQWQIDAAVTNQNDFDKGAKDKSFDIAQRIRTAFEFIANENLKGVLETQIGSNSWGNGQYSIAAGRTPNQANAGANSAGNGNLIMRKAYIDFKVPSTKVNVLAGYQSITLPSAFGGGSPILDDHMAGIAAVIPVNDNLSLVAGYARPYDFNTAGSTANVQRSGEAVDAALMYANIDLKGFKIQPFAAYSYGSESAINRYANNVGTTSTATALGLFSPNGVPSGYRAYWLGAAFTMTAFEPFKVMADLSYGNATYNNTTARKSGRGGWFGDIAVDYTGLSMMTPELFFAYSTGEDSDLTKSERMPVVSGENWAYGTFWMQGGESQNNSYTGPARNLGFWALGLALKDIKLIDKLTHNVYLIYFKGTNDQNLVNASSGLIGSYGNFLTEKDHLFEVDVNSKYQIYDQLSLGLELGYISAHFDKSLWAGKLGASRDSSMLSKDAYKATLMLNYSF